jgi:hypothetical protein
VVEAPSASAQQWKPHYNDKCASLHQKVWVVSNVCCLNLELGLGFVAR